MEPSICSLQELRGLTYLDVSHNLLPAPAQGGEDDDPLAVLSALPRLRDGVPVASKFLIENTYYMSRWLKHDPGLQKQITLQKKRAHAVA